jgi:hypothetical protein
MNNEIQQKIVKIEPVDQENKTMEDQLKPLKSENLSLSKQVDIETLNTKQTHDQIGIH